MMRTKRTRIGGARGVALAGGLVAAGLGIGVRHAVAVDDLGEVRAVVEAEGVDEAIPTVAAARRLLGIEAERSEGGTLLRLRADGEIAGAKSMLLDSPPRLVLDLPGMKSSTGIHRLAIESEHAARVRIGQHDDRLRVVVDGGSAERPFAGHVIVPQPDGLAVGFGAEAAKLTGGTPAIAQVEPASQATTTLEPPTPAPGVELPPVASSAQTDSAGEPGAGVPTPVAATAESAPLGAPESAPVESPADAAPIPAASAPTAATPASAAPTTRVHGVQFDAQPERDRLVIVVEGRTTHSILRPDSETLVISLPDARLDTPDPIRVTPQEPGPVSLVTAVQMPDAEVPEVRVAIARAPGAEPRLSEEAGLLILDFPRSTTATKVRAADPVAIERVAHRAMPAQKVEPAKAPPAQAGTTGGSDMLQEGGLVGGKTYTGRRISLDFKDVEIADVLRLIAEVSDLNVIAGDEVKGQVTIRLTDVPWDQALDVILLTKGLGFVLVGNVLRIAPQEVLKAEEAARLEERRAKEKLEDLVVKILPVNYASVSEVEGMVKKLLTSRGSVNIDKRTNTLILKDIPSVVDEAVALTKAIDTPTPQVLIDSKIVEAKLDFLRDLGAQWGVGSNPEDADGDFSDDFTIGDETILTRGTSSFPFQQANNVVVQNPITSTANGILNLGGWILNERLNLSLRLAAAESEGEGKVISSPRVVTLDNREAKIEQGVSIPFQTFENGDAQLEFIDAVLSLLVTPHITADRSIIMKITVTRNAPDFAVPTPTGSPAIAKNEARTETLVKNGQTLVLGGIYTIDRSESQTRVPFLYRLPIIGVAFKEDKVTDKRRELLIFVTPRIVEAQTAQN